MHLRKGFTLIELLVVISIIALLIGILLPALGKARDSGYKAQDLANSRSNGQAIFTYMADNQFTFPTAYQYRSANDFDNTTIGTSSSTGYLQWSGVLIQQGYFDAGKGSVAPKHAPGGWAATNFDDGTAITTANAITNGTDEGALINGQLSQSPGIIDTQAPRLSYVPNEAIMGRLKTQAIQSGELRLVRSDNVQKAAGTILLATYTGNINQIAGTSVSGGAALKTHRPASAVKVGAAGGTYDGERSDGIEGGSGGSAGSSATDLRALSLTEAETAMAAALAGTGGQHHISYIDHRLYESQGSVYTFCDGHAETIKPELVFDENDWKWGLKMYSQKNQVNIRNNAGTANVN